MAYFYDQDNPQNSRELSTVTTTTNVARYEEQGRNVVRKSTMTPAQRERAKVIKAQQRKKERQRRLAGLCAACLVVGGIAVNTVSNVIDSYKEMGAVYSQTSEFRKDVISPNTHRTSDNQHYFYDYDDIAEYIQGDGRDFSLELYKTYANIGEYQTNRVLNYTQYDSVEAYVEQAGFKSIKEWEKSEREKIVLQSEMDEKQTELAAMHRELNGQEISAAIENGNSFGGGK